MTGVLALDAGGHSMVLFTTELPSSFEEDRPSAVPDRDLAVRFYKFRF